MARPQEQRTKAWVLRIEAAEGASSLPVMNWISSGRVPAHRTVDQAGMRAMRQIAEATAGRMIPITKNLSTSLRFLLEEGNATYEIAFIPRSAG